MLQGENTLAEISGFKLGYRHGGTRPAVCGVRSEILLRHLSSVVYRDSIHYLITIWVSALIRDVLKGEGRYRYHLLGWLCMSQV